MPRNLGTSRKGKPNKHDRESGMGKSLIKLHANKYRPRSDGKNRHGDGGMTMTQGVTSIGIDPITGTIADTNTTKSVLELQELDDFLLTAELANQQFAVEHEGLVILDETARHYSHQQQANTPRVKFADDNNNDMSQQSSGTTVPSFAFTELSVPRRPRWDSTTTPQQLEINERDSFLQWRRSIAQQEEKLFSLDPSSNTTTTNGAATSAGSVNSHIAATPFEKNLQVWRQLWRVLERSDCVLQLVDGRNPLFYLSYDLKRYATDDLQKPMMILVNKSDYLSAEQRQQWYDYLTKEHGWDPDSILFFSAMTEQNVLDEAAYQERRKQAQRELFENADAMDQNLDDKVDKDNETDDDVDDSDSEDDDGDRNGQNIFGTEEDGTDPDEENDDDDNGNDALTNDDLNNSGSQNIYDSGNITQVTATQQLQTNTISPTQVENQSNQSTLEHLALNKDEKLNSTNDDEPHQPSDSIGIDRPLSRTQLLDAMMKFAQSHKCTPNPKYDRIQFGMVGFPNVGKSSVINVLVGSSKHTHGLVRVAVANQPGKTKHFQTLLLPDRTDMMLCDCPGLVFPSFVSNTADLIAAGVYPIAQMREHWSVMSLICQRIPRPIIESLYGMQLPVPIFDTTYSNYAIDMTGANTSSGAQSFPPPTPEEFLGTFCVARGMLAANSGVPDYQRAARMIVKDYSSGKLLYCHPPPSVTDVAAFQKETIQTAIQNTHKLQEKLALRQKQQDTLSQRKTNAKQNNTESRVDSADTGTNNDNPIVDDDMLELLGGINVNLDLVQRGMSSKKLSTAVNEDTFDKFGKRIKTPKTKWGKKNRKNRNPDPYGCHSTPDDSLISYTSTGTSTTTGLIVQGGKRYTTGGYTRPTSYPILE